MFKNLVIASFLGLVAIILGAFGAHALKEILSASELQSFNTAVRYQIYHVLVLFFVNTYSGFSLQQKNTVSYLLFIGILFFSGSIYAIQLTPITAKSIWFVTPLGGSFFIFAWLTLLIFFLKKALHK
ncbi:DUF423 domain-containing protein [uncultured Polaribacter sp.]|uniref:DUF423 domain-containing protein n=1 Tax=uncultured Polaribacter sp. TaxID=174711 RepID=UPI00262DD78C|nr:DUF423 domain-containing protein [uncultured Polaribacter sp.]